MAASPKTMSYRFLGDSGLLVSTLSLGNWMIYYPDSAKDDWYDVVKTAYGLGINFFDSAEVYNDGRGDEFMGYAIQRGIKEGVWTREDLVLTAKFSLGSKGLYESGPNGIGNSRKHLVEGMKRTLKHMEVDYVDVVFSHRQDIFTPIEETVRTMNFIINQGWAFYWGTSEWSSSDIKEACDIADRLGMIRPIVEQPQYNMFERNKIEHELVDLFTKYKLGTTVWSPLADGVLTGKYNKEIPSDARLADPAIRAWTPDFEAKVEKVRKLEVIANRLGCTLAQLATAWVASNPNVSTVLLGARNSHQLTETVKAIEHLDKITPELKTEIDTIIQFVPKRTSYDMWCTARERYLEGDLSIPVWGNPMGKPKAQ